MLVDAELFVFSDEVLVEVLGRIGEADLALVLPPLFDRPEYDQPTTLRAAFQVHLRSEAAAQQALCGQWRSGAAPAFDDQLTASALQSLVVRAAAAVTQAALQAADARAVLATSEGPLSVQDYLQRLTVIRCLVAHYVAALLGSTACPLPEELARPLWELTHPAAHTWRDLGLFRSPLPLPAHVSWRDRFLLCAGHEQHPMGH